MNILNHDVKATTLLFASCMVWMLGFPEQAARINEECVRHARRCGHAFDLAYALTFGASVLYHLGQPDEVLRRAEEAERLGRENRLPFVHRGSGAKSLWERVDRAGPGLRRGGLAQGGPRLLGGDRREERHPLP